MPAVKRDELLDDVRARLMRVEETLAKMQETLSRVEAAEEQARRLANEHSLAHERIENRLRELEATRQRAEGAIWAWRLALIAAGAVGGWLVKHFGGGVR